jgi:hypothetical protein
MLPVMTFPSFLPSFDGAILALEILEDGLAPNLRPGGLNGAIGTEGVVVCGNQYALG